MRKRWLVAMGLIVVAAAAAWPLAKLRRMVRIGVGYAAEQTCACLFVSQRPLASCRHDLDPVAQRLISLAPGPAAVVARAWPLARATARYEPGFGCTLGE
jgi:hypothetical protein